MPDGPILVGRVHRTLRDVEVLVYDYDSLNVETTILPAGSIFQPWTPQDHWRGEKVPITLGDQATGFDWGVSSPSGHFLRWDDFFAAGAEGKVQVVGGPRILDPARNVHMRRSVWILFPVLALLSACNREPEAVATIEKYRPAVEVRLAAIKQIGQKLDTVPPLASDGAVLDSGPLQLGTGIDAPLPADNAILETAPRLSGDLGADPGDGVGTRDLWWCAKLIGDKYYAERSSPGNAEAYLGHCANAKYLLVVRVLENVHPEVDEGQGTFRPGSMAGEVRVFNLGSGRDLGGFRFKAENSELVTHRDGQGRDYTAVASDLASQVRGQISAGIAKYLMTAERASG